MFLYDFVFFAVIIVLCVIGVWLFGEKFDDFDETPDDYQDRHD